MCLLERNWSENWVNCSCMPLCDSVDYFIVNRQLDDFYERDSRMLKVTTYVNKSRIKRDILFSIDYLIGR